MHSRQGRRTVQAGSNTVKAFFTFSHFNNCYAPQQDLSSLWSVASTRYSFFSYLVLSARCPYLCQVDFRKYLPQLDFFVLFGGHIDLDTEKPGTSSNHYTLEFRDVREIESIGWVIFLHGCAKRNMQNVRTVEQELTSSTIQEDVAAFVRASSPRESLPARPLSPWHDLATLALLTEAGELSCASSTQFSPQARARLHEFVGASPAHYWDDLLHYARALKILDIQEDEKLHLFERSAELLGATRREVFPALYAVWLQRPLVISELFALTADRAKQQLLRLDLLRFVGLLEPGRWYGYDAAGYLLYVACQRQEIELSPTELRALTPLYVERILLILGAIDIDQEGRRFCVHPSPCLPPLPPGLSRPRPLSDKATAFRNVIAQQLKQNDAWRQVSPGLARCIEVRRDRQARPDSLQLLDAEAQHLQTDPRLPFRDCLFLTHLGRLVPSSSNGMPCKPGSYTFALDVDTLRETIEKGLPVQEIKLFLEERCDRHCLQSVRDLLHSACAEER